MKNPHAVALMSQTICIILGTMPLILASCKNETPKKQPPAAAAQEQAVTADPTTPGATTPVVDLNLRIEALNNPLEFPVGQEMRASFTVKGAGTRVIMVGLAKAPAGFYIEGANTANPVLVWKTPQNSTPVVQFILRDQAECLRLEAIDSACDLSADVTEMAKSYDKLSNEFPIKIGSGPIIGGNPVVPGVVGGDKLSLAAAIIPLAIQLIQGGASGGANLGQLTSLLATLDMPKLQALLNSMQNGGTDLATVISQLGTE